MARLESVCLLLAFGLAGAQEEGSCYSSGSIALSVVLSVIFTALLWAALYYLWRKFRKPKGESRHPGS
ncbi:hypothetical protein BDFB_011119 [Asbolus verrucosus]|uniref:Uncharacterized protein n=1 Tax=Asbolus verrucosus TaxID=1661398 RepID=A0A482W7K9_ASBVE|nr:hypothetical protein BDFB_011119 [Asbolus verrucosus]